MKFTPHLILQHGSREERTYFWSLHRQASRTIIWGNQIDQLFLKKKKKILTFTLSICVITLGDVSFIIIDLDFGISICFDRYLQKYRIALGYQFIDRHYWKVPLFIRKVGK